MITKNLPAFKTKKDARSQGYLSEADMYSHTPKRTAVPIRVKGELFYHMADCELLVSDAYCKEEGLRPKAGAQPHSVKYRESDTEPDNSTAGAALQIGCHTWQATIALDQLGISADASGQYPLTPELVATIRSEAWRWIQVDRHTEATRNAIALCEREYGPLPTAKSGQKNCTRISDELQSILVMLRETGENVYDARPYEDDE